MLPTACNAGELSSSLQLRQPQALEEKAGAPAEPALQVRTPVEVEAITPTQYFSRDNNHYPGHVFSRSNAIIHVLKQTDSS